MGREGDGRDEGGGWRQNGETLKAGMKVGERLRSGTAEKEFAQAFAPSPSAAAAPTANCDIRSS